MSHNHFIDINRFHGFEQIDFPDGQPHVRLPETVFPGCDVDVQISITDADKLLQLMLISDAIDGSYCKKRRLRITYLMGARYDRRMYYGDSFDLKVIARMINSCGFSEVVILHPHSDTALALVDNSIAVGNGRLINEYKMTNAVLICPDAGAAKHVDKYKGANKNIVDVAYCMKGRDSEGNVNLTLFNPEKCRERNCVIIDDLCDGGATFVAIGKQTPAAHLTLMVTHGIFSKGFSELEKYFNEIITTDSYFLTNPLNHSKLKTVSANTWTSTRFS